MDNRFSARDNWGALSAKTIYIFAGTRPEIIKTASVVRELRRRSEAAAGAWRVHYCFTGQHLELALPFLKFFDVEPDSQLELMHPGQSLGMLTSRAAAQVDAFLEKHGNAAAALVQGDTTTAFVAGLVSFYHRVPVGHIEAGLRTSSIEEPFPEELNRRLLTRLARWHWAPTETARQSLASEQVDAASIRVTGNTGIDSLTWALGRVREPELPQLRALSGRRIVLVTAHRRENIGPPLEEITRTLADLARRHLDITFVLPVHKNPRVVETVRRNLSGIANFQLVDPLEYGDLVWAMRSCELILSDSGGIQEEAPTLKKPVLVLRNETERPEAVAHGTSIIVGSNREKILAEAEGFLSGTRKLALKSETNPYGDGKAASRIADHLLHDLGLQP